MFSSFFHVAEAPSNQEWPDSPPGGSKSSSSEAVGPKENELRNDAYDYTERYCGHCNTTTDIKEANFFGRYLLLSSPNTLIKAPLHYL